MTLSDLMPTYRAVHVTAEYEGRRYFITHTQGHGAAEAIALDFVARYPEARFFVGDVYGSQTLHGKARDFRTTYEGQTI